MIKSFYLLLFLLLFQTNVKAAKNYLEYHRRIIDAEELFLNNNINAALEKYKGIFSNFRPFAKDCYIALELAGMTQDTGKTTFFLLKGFENGLSWKTATSIVGIQRLFAKYPKYQMQILNTYNKYRQQYISQIDCFLRATCVSMQKKDAVFHELSSSWANRNTRDSLYSSVLSENVLEFVEIVKKYGFPGERKIGNFDSELDGYCDESLNLRFEPVVTMFFYHSGCAYVNLKRELFEAVKSGEIHPRTYGLILEWAYQDLKDQSKNRSKNNLSRFYGKKCPVGIQDKYYNLYINHREDNKDTVRVNKDRAEIGISSLAHDMKKREYARKNNLILFFGLFQGEPGII